MLASVRPEWRQAQARTCTPIVQSLTRLPARIDNVLALDTSGSALILAGPLSSGIRYLPKDSLMRVTGAGKPVWRDALPPYITPPGVSLANHDAGIYVVIDHTVLLLDAATGRLNQRRRLDLQALGWPAAVATGPGDYLFVAGQPTTGWAAVVEALTFGTVHGKTFADNTAGIHSVNMDDEPIAVVWRARLGLFHAGIWLGPALHGQLAVYLPGAYDAPGTIAWLDERNGALQPAYAIAASPLAADPARNRLYIDDAGTIRALNLKYGQSVAVATGTAPLAVVPRRGLVAFLRGNSTVLASASTLRTIASVTLPGVTALAATPGGSALLVGLRGGLARLDLTSCTATQ